MFCLKNHNLRKNLSGESLNLVLTSFSFVIVTSTTSEKSHLQLDVRLLQLPGDHFWNVEVSFHIGRQFDDEILVRRHWYNALLLSDVFFARFDQSTFVRPVEELFAEQNRLHVLVDFAQNGPIRTLDFPIWNQGVSLDRSRAFESFLPQILGKLDPKSAGFKRSGFPVPNVDLRSKVKN